MKENQIRELIKSVIQEDKLDNPQLAQEDIKELISEYLQQNLTFEVGSANDFYSSGYSFELILRDPKGRQTLLGSGSITTSRD